MKRDRNTPHTWTKGPNAQFPGTLLGSYQDPVPVRPFGDEWGGWATPSRGIAAAQSRTPVGTGMNGPYFNGDQTHLPGQDDVGSYYK